PPVGCRREAVLHALHERKSVPDQARQRWQRRSGRRRAGCNIESARKKNGPIDAVLHHVSGRGGHEESMGMKFRTVAISLWMTGAGCSGSGASGLVDTPHPMEDAAGDESPRGMPPEPTPESSTRDDAGGNEDAGPLDASHE